MQNDSDKIELSLKGFFLEELKDIVALLDTRSQHNNNTTRANERAKSLIRMIESRNK